MSLEAKSKHHEQGQDKFMAPLTTYTMTTRDYIMRPNAAAGAFTITLPPVSACKGRFYSIIAENATNVLAITIQNQDESEGWSGDLVLNEKGRGGIFYSDGMKWHYGDKHFTSSLVAGAVNLDEVHLTMDTAGEANVDALIVRVTSPVGLGNSAGAIFAQMNYSAAAGHVSGMSYAVGAEMILPNIAAIPSGHYTCIDFEMSAGNVCDWAGSTKVSYMRFAAWGTQTSIDDNAFWFTLAATELVDHLVSATAQTIRCQIEALTAGINKTRYVVLSQDQDVLYLTGTMAAATTKICRLTPTINNMAMGDGMGAVEIDVTSTGSDANFNAALSAWMSINSITGGNLVTPMSVGIWENGASGDVSSSPIIMGMRMQCTLTNAPSYVALFSVNSNAAGNPDAVFSIGTPADLGITETANEAGACFAYIPMYRDAGGNIRYVRVYSTTA